MCSCVGGFSGVNCESECIVRRGKSHGCRMTQNDDPLIFSHFITISLSVDLSEWRNTQ